jgi:DNA polymerase-3 subunit epsilon
VEPHFLSRLVERLPRTHRPSIDAYLDVLDRALLDRHISAVEANALVAVADRLGLAREDLDELHRHYLQALATVAALDGEIGDHERADLEGLADLLAVEPDYVSGVLSTARHAVALTGGPSTSPSKRLYLRQGDEVVFTGETRPPREVWEEQASAAGLRVGKDVTTRTRLLVAADPDTMSGKAEKAARYGIPIVHTSAFTRMLKRLNESA